MKGKLLVSILCLIAVFSALESPADANKIAFSWNSGTGQSGPGTFCYLTLDPVDTTETSRTVAATAQAYWAIFGAASPPPSSCPYTGTPVWLGGWFGCSDTETYNRNTQTSGSWACTCSIPDGFPGGLCATTNYGSWDIYCINMNCGTDKGVSCGTCGDSNACTSDSCSANNCVYTPYCSGTDTNCGCSSCTNCNSQDGYTGSSFCQAGDVYRTYRDYFCSGYSCASSDSNQLIQDCGPSVCCNGACCAAGQVCYNNACCTPVTCAGRCGWVDQGCGLGFT